MKPSRGDTARPKTRWSPRHWHIIWLFAQGKTTSEVTGYCPTWIRALAHRYNDKDPQGLGDRRHSNPGGTFILSQEQQAQLHQALDEPPADGGLLGA